MIRQNSRSSRLSLSSGDGRSQPDEGGNALEDYLELVSGLPFELQRLLTLLRELDHKAEKKYRETNALQDEYLSWAKARLAATQQPGSPPCTLEGALELVANHRAKLELDDVRGELHSLYAEKVAVAEQARDLVASHTKRLRKDLTTFGRYLEHIGAYDPAVEEQLAEEAANIDQLVDGMSTTSSQNSSAPPDRNHRDHHHQRDHHRERDRDRGGGSSTGRERGRPSKASTREKKAAAAAAAVDGSHSGKGADVANVLLAAQGGGVAGSDNSHYGGSAMQPRASPGDQVAAHLTDAGGDGSLEGEWVLAQVVECILSGSGGDRTRGQAQQHQVRYKVMDEDDHNKTYIVDDSQLVTLHHGHSSLPAKGETVLAVYPDTTAFYRGVLTALPPPPPRRGGHAALLQAQQSAVCQVQFVDDADDDGHTPHRSVPARYVIRVP
uniref:SGF29 C-terminal domain-containing protein n=1 Tax=Fibrocapsa japonica TaxID=94617 RepID=A0A7S2UWQ3_9STRA|mmetsp:Transcript_17441/g.25459  ORF Transcript_17441/g.25459 Transcript_17441/m.25459 type:complete len:439 (-) Transcript_17441:169-1485(-)|eukprot:CAMPEP_0113938136 /NCGR_PEP_ID=MMETSP1339-20121228/4540_1 /TAXON_ID=94617 /ORGANISM="Fibrocapsa japonica" /LENGTH=438 /DNA_ID=CAMNT_0000941097 /DNA_START=157 /DNA_END=1473 /DNA_ORIENTATION=- /assembly_acc=CAM_ASM_000762